MKKMINTSFAYLIAGLTSGVFFREFTKFNQFEGYSQIKVIHTHTLMLGMFMFLIVALFFIKFNLAEDIRFNRFYITYNVGLIMSILLMLGRGITQVLEMDVSKGLNASISGMAGLGHIIMTIGLMYLFAILRSQASKLNNTSSQ